MSRKLVVITFIATGILNIGLCLGAGDCPKEDASCQKDNVGYEAISQLHAQIDDNHDGGLNFAESDEFVRDDLKHADGLPRRNFHSNDDFVTVHDLWKLWATSEVYNWTIDDVISWLTRHVELPQYVDNFRANSVSGRLLPRLASNSQSFAIVLGIKNPVHKQKLAIKATDLVLFGPPKHSHNYLKDLMLVTSLLVGLFSAYFAYKKRSEAINLNLKVNKDLSDLQNAEDALRQMQLDLVKAQQEQQTIADDKINLEKRLQDEIKLAKAEAEKVKAQRDPLDESSALKLAEEELLQVRIALCNAEKRLEDNQCLPIFELQHWLQLCYEIETKYFDAKRETTEKQLRAAKEMCEKIRKQKGKFLGAFRVAHTTSLDETDSKIMSVRASLEEVKMDMQERMQRWQHIEQICNFKIISNPGVIILESLLKRPDKGLNKVHASHMTLDDSDESMPSTMLAQAVHHPSASDLSFHSSSGTMNSGSSSQPGRGYASSTLPTTGLRSRQPLQGSGSQDSLLSIDRPVTSMSKEKISGVVFDLGGELPMKPLLPKNPSSDKLLTTAIMASMASKMDPTTMTKSISLPTPSQSHPIPNSRSEATINTSNHIPNANKPKETSTIQKGASASKLNQDVGSNGSQDDGNSSDSLSAGHETTVKEKKRFSLFKRPKKTN